jgi:Holliday junction resolvase
MSQYARGRAIEYKAIKYLEKLGSTHVIRSAGSHGLVDLIAFFPRERAIRLIQVKKQGKGISENYLKKRYAELCNFNGEWHVESVILIKKERGFKILYL